MLQSSYSQTMPPGLAGAAMREGIVERGANSYTTVQAWTVTVSGATDAKVYTVSFSYTGDDGRLIEGSVSHTAQTSATTTTVATGIKAAWNASALASSLGYATSSSAVVTITSRSILNTFTVSDSDAQLACASSGGATPAHIPYGRLVYRPASDAKLLELNATNLSALTYTLTPAAVNSQTYTVFIDIPGIGVWPNVTAGDGSATVTEIVDAFVAIINGLVPANSIVASNDSDTLLLTSEVDGLWFRAGGGSSSASATWTVATNGAATINTAVGFAMRKQDHVTTLSSGVAGYAAFDEVSVLSSGVCLVETDASLVNGSQLYYHTSGASIGKWSNTSASTNVPAPARYRLVESVSSSLATIAVGA